MKVHGVQDDQMMETLTADCSDEPLHIRILPWRSWSSARLLDAHSSKPAPKYTSVDLIPIPQHILWSCVIRKDLHDLLGRPFSRRMVGDAKMKNRTPLIRQHEENIEDTESRRGEGK